MEFKFCTQTDVYQYCSIRWRPQHNSFRMANLCHFQDGHQFHCQLKKRSRMIQWQVCSVNWDGLFGQDVDSITTVAFCQPPSGHQTTESTMASGTSKMPSIAGFQGRVRAKRRLNLIQCTLVLEFVLSAVSSLINLNWTESHLIGWNCRLVYLIATN